MRDHDSVCPKPALMNEQHRLDDSLSAHRHHFRDDGGNCNEVSQNESGRRTDTQRLSTHEEYVQLARTGLEAHKPVGEQGWSDGVSNHQHPRTKQNVRDLTRPVSAANAMREFRDVKLWIDDFERERS